MFNSNPRRIDLHHHIIPPDYGGLLREKGIRPGGIDLPQWSAQASREVMKKVDVETAILSLSTPGAWFGDVQEARHLARSANEYAAEVVADDPQHFGFFATLTLPDVDGAIAEATYALDELKADGIVLLANNAGLYLGDPQFDCLLAFLNERKCVVFVHPGELPAEPVPGVPTFTADFLLDTTRTAMSLVMNGAMERYPNIRFVLSHAGGFLPYIAYRSMLTMVHAQPKWKQAGLVAARPVAVRQQMSVLKRFWFDVALSSTPAALPSLLAMADHNRIVYGSDFPFAPGVAVRFMAKEYEGFRMKRSTRQRIDRRNAETLFPRLAGQ